jgi:hypothetical protein
VDDIETRTTPGWRWAMGLLAFAIRVVVLDTTTGTTILETGATRWVHRLPQRCQLWDEEPLVAGGATIHHRRGLTALTGR